MFMTPKDVQLSLLLTAIKKIHVENPEKMLWSKDRKKQEGFHLILLTNQVNIAEVVYLFSSGEGVQELLLRY